MVGYDTHMQKQIIIPNLVVGIILTLIELILLTWFLIMTLHLKFKLILG